MSPPSVGLSRGTTVIHGVARPSRSRRSESCRASLAVESSTRHEWPRPKPRGATRFPFAANVMLPTKSVTASVRGRPRQSGGRSVVVSSTMCGSCASMPPAVNRTGSVTARRAPEGATTVHAVNSRTSSSPPPQPPDRKRGARRRATAEDSPKPTRASISPARDVAGAARSVVSDYLDSSTRAASGSTPAAARRRNLGILRSAESRSDARVGNARRVLRSSLETPRFVASAEPSGA